MIRARGAPPVTVVGIGDDGCLGLSARAIDAVARARVLAGGARHLAFFPQFAGERILLDGALGPALERVADLADEHPVCVLASGDPLFFGVGARLVERVGLEHVEVIPHPASVQWAFARAGLPWHDAAFLSLHGRPATGLAARLRARAKAALLTDAARPPAAVARHLLDFGATGWRALVCERLAGPGERVRRFDDLAALAASDDADPLNVVLLVRSDQAWRPPPALPALDDDAFERRRGLLTKREVRLQSLAALRLPPDAVVWDVGAGSGAVAIEAALLAPEGRVHAVERDPELCQLVRRNCRRHGADNVAVVEGVAPAALHGLEAPDAVFVGGSGGELAGILAAAAARLRAGGRIVVNAVALETLEDARRRLACAGFEVAVTLVAAARGAALAGLTRLEPLSPVFVLAASRPGEGR